VESISAGPALRKVIAKQGEMTTCAGPAKTKRFVGGAVLAFSVTLSHKAAQGMSRKSTLLDLIRGRAPVSRKGHALSLDIAIM
jgi:hypothetical protein